MKINSFSKPQQAWIVAMLVLPYAVSWILATDVLPDAWRFDRWPEDLRTLCIVFFSLFLAADALFAFWFLFGGSDEGRPPTGPARKVGEP